MTRENISKTFTVPIDSNHPYAKDIIFDFGDQIMQYIEDEIIKKESFFNMKRLDEHSDSHSDATFVIPDLSYSNDQVGGVTITRYYVFDNTDNNKLALTIGLGYSGGENKGLNLNTYSSTNNFNMIIQINMFYTRENLLDLVNTNYNSYYASTIVGSNGYGFMGIGATSCIQDSVNRITIIANNNGGVWTCTLPLMRISNSSVKGTTFNTSEHAIPRIAIVETNNTSIYKAYFWTSNQKDNHSDDIEKPNCSYIFILDKDSLFRFGVPNFLSGVTFKNKGDKIPSVPLWLSSSNTSSPTDYNYSKVLKYFLQTSDSEVEVGNRYIINGAVYICIGNRLLMRE